MKKIAIVLLLALCIAPVSVWADYGRFDLDLHWLMQAGINDISGGEEAVAALADYRFVLPQMQVHYWLDLGPARLGLGTRLFSLILINAAFPSISAEIDLADFTLGASVAGGGLLYFGLVSGFELVNFYMPQVTFGYHLTDWFDVGVGATFNTLSMDDITMDGAPYVISAYGRFKFGKPQDAE